MTSGAKNVYPDFSTGPTGWKDGTLIPIKSCSFTIGPGITGNTAIEKLPYHDRKIRHPYLGILNPDDINLVLFAFMLPVLISHFLHSMAL